MYKAKRLTIKSEQHGDYKDGVYYLESIHGWLIGLGEFYMCGIYYPTCSDVKKHGGSFVPWLDEECLDAFAVSFERTDKRTNETPGGWAAEGTSGSGRR